jgi:hypothetical protein
LRRCPELCNAITNWWREMMNQNNILGQEFVARVASGGELGIIPFLRFTTKQLTGHGRTRS